MDGLFLKSSSSLFSLLLLACVPISHVSQNSVAQPNQATRQTVRERLTGIVVTSENQLASWADQRFAIANSPKDAEGGSATPISSDGYFLTADHVLSNSMDRNIFIIYGRGGRILTSKARIVWRSKADDIALLHIPFQTPYFYQWTPAKAWLSPGHPIVHGGMATGMKSAAGRLRSPLAPENFLTPNRAFKIDIPLQPGDSGGPVVDAYGNLLGINSAVEFLIPMETAIFIDSEANRPNVQKIQALIQKDRSQK
jgi:S1-C subfamily serine protease